MSFQLTYRIVHYRWRGYSIERIAELFGLEIDQVEQVLAQQPRRAA